MIGIYRFEFPNGDFYLGSSVQLQKRKRQHLNYLKRGKHPNLLMQRVYDKYGEPTFHVHLECSKEELREQEQYWLDQYFGLPWFINLARSAESPTRGQARSEETKEKISQSLRGHTITEQVRVQISEKLKGRKIDPEVVARRAEARRGIPRAEETKQKISAAQKGKPRNPHTEETRLKLSQNNMGKNAKPILQLDTHGNIVAKWNSVKEAAEHLGCVHTGISQVLTGKRKTALGYFWQYND